MRSRTPIPSFDIYRDHDLEDIDETSDRESEPEEQVVDPLRRLAIENHYLPALTNLLSFLEPIDLARASCVSKAWSSVIACDPKARRRKETYVADMRQLRSSVGQENWPMKEPESAKPKVRAAFRDLKSHQQPVRQFCDTPKVEDLDDDVFCKDANKSTTRRPIRPVSQSVNRINSCVRTNRSCLDYKTPQFKSIRFANCNSGGDTGSIIKAPVDPIGLSHHKSLSCAKSISRRLLDEDTVDGMSQRRLSLAGSRSSKKNLRRL